MNAGIIRRFIIETPLYKYSQSESSAIRALYIYGHPLIVCALLAYVAALTGTIVLSANIWGGTYSEFVALHANASSMPAAATTFFLVLPAAFVVMTTTLVPRIWFAEEKGWHAIWTGKSLFWRVRAFVGLILLAICGGIGMAIPGDPSFCNGCTTNSHVGLFLLYGIGLPTFIAGCIAGCIALIRITTVNQKTIVSSHG